MFATLRLPLALPWVFEVFLKLIHSSLLGLGLLAVLVLVGMLGRAPGADAAALAGNIAARFGNPSSATPPDSTVLPARLDTRMDAVAEYIARRYRVSRNAVEEIVRTTEVSARAAGLDPMLVLAMIGIESGFNPLSESVMGAQGLMQVIGKYHVEKFSPTPDSNALLDPETNVRVGVAIIKEYLDLTGKLEAALQRYAGAADDEELAYTGKVLAEKRRLEQAVRQKLKSASA